MICREDMPFLLQAAGQLLFPRRCPFCDRVIGFVPECGECAQALKPLLLEKKRLAPGTHYFGALDGAAAVYRYKGCVREAVHRLKYHGRQCYGADLGNAMVRALFGCTFSRKYGILFPERVDFSLLEWDVIVPVPKSSRSRGYNVPLLLAKPIAQGLGLPILPEALQRRSFSKHQAGLPLEERLANVAGAFAAADPGAVEGKRVLLVDDIITTGATAAACTQALLDAGAQSVFAVALASSQWQDEI